MGMKAMKAMKKSVIAKGKLAKMVVFRGTKSKTGSGLKKSDLMKNKSGKIVSRKQSANGKKAYARIKGWTVAVTKARKLLASRASCGEEGLAPLQEGEGVLRPVSTSCVPADNGGALGCVAFARPV